MNEYLDIMRIGEKNPNKFIKEVLGKNLWAKQKEIIDAVFKYPRVAVKSCNSAGKSYTASTLALTALYTHFDSIVLTTAPTRNQVFNVMWREIRGSHTESKIPLGGVMLKESLSISDNWYAMGFATDNPENARGFHARGGYLLYIIDEASGVSPEIMDAIEGTLTTSQTRLLYIGNPTVGQGKFYDAFSSQFFHKVSIPVWDTPNFIANGIKSVEDLRKFNDLEEVNNLENTHPFLVNPSWAYIRLQDWGEDSPMFQSLVEANFPTESDSVLIPVMWIERAIKKEFTEEEEKEKLDILSIGIDVARGKGGDMSVLTPMRGFEELQPFASNTIDPMQLVGHAIHMFNECKGQIKRDIFVVDDTGVGGGVTSRLQELGYNVLPINFAGGATAENTTEKYANIKAQIFWQLRLAFKDDKIKILDYSKTIRHLSLMKYDFQVGKMRMISKDLLTESPDFADSLALALHGVILYGQGGFDYNDTEEMHDVETITGDIFSQKF